MPRKKSAGAAAQRPLQTKPAEEQIRKRAYELYLARNGGAGSELDDWLKAEQELVSPAKPSRRKTTEPRQ